MQNPLLYILRLSQVTVSRMMRIIFSADIHGALPLYFLHPVGKSW
ncbi:MAG TPA: hypothetical protein VGP66_05835 [Candidatus Acidoferrum sp.]|nr:hypothetical protein [Candidatus Acidoferrum sp.]